MIQCPNFRGNLWIRVFLIFTFSAFHLILLPDCTQLQHWRFLSVLTFISVICFLYLRDSITNKLNRILNNLLLRFLVPLVVITGLLMLLGSANRYFVDCCHFFLLKEQYISYATQVLQKEPLKEADSKVSFFLSQNGAVEWMEIGGCKSLYFPLRQNLFVSRGYLYSTTDFELSQLQSVQVSQPFMANWMWVTLY